MGSDGMEYGSAGAVASMWLCVAIISAVALWIGEAHWTILIFVGLMVLLAFAFGEDMLHTGLLRRDGHEDLTRKIDQIDEKIEAIKKSLEE